MSEAARYTDIVMFDANKVGGLSGLSSLRQTFPHGCDVLSVPDGVYALVRPTHPWAVEAAAAVRLLVDAHQLETLTVACGAAGLVEASQVVQQVGHDFPVRTKLVVIPEPSTLQANRCIVLCADGRQFDGERGITQAMLPELFMTDTAVLVLPGGPHLLTRADHDALLRRWHATVGADTPMDGLFHEGCAKYAVTGVPHTQQPAAFAQDGASWLRHYNSTSRAGVVRIDRRNTVTGIDWINR